MANETDYRRSHYEGYDAAWSGVECPFLEGSPEEDAWFEGRERALDEMELEEELEELFNE